MNGTGMWWSTSLQGDKESKIASRKVRDERTRWGGGRWDLEATISRELARCVVSGGMLRILGPYHDSHSHIAGAMIVRILQGRYYWPTRVKDAMR